MPVVVTVTQSAVAVAASTSSSSGDASSTLPAGAIAGIIIGTLLGLVLFVVLAFYLLRRRWHRFTRVANPAHDPVSTSAGALDLPRINSRIATNFTRHSKKLSVSSEPLISPVSWPPIPHTSRVHSPGTPPRSHSISPGIRDSQYSIGEITQVIGSGTVSSSPAPAILNIPPARKPEQTFPSPNPQQTFFIHRMLQSRAQASEGVSLAHNPSLGFVQSRSTTLDSSAIHADEERLLADAEHTALRDAETFQRDEERIPLEEDDWEEAASTESMYSQLSAPLDHSSLFSDPVSRRNSPLSVHRRKSSRRQPHTTELTPVAEAPDTPRVLEGRSGSRPVSIAANSSLDGQISHGTASRPMSSASLVDQSGTLPLLTSTNFGKESTASGTTVGSISSTAGWGSNSSGRASRYPSLAPSSIGQSGPRSDGGTDWHHLPPGLSGLKTLQMGSLRNPHSPVEEQPEELFASSAPDPADPTLAKCAHLREGTVSSIPEVERRTVMQGGIARIDIAL